MLGQILLCLVWINSSSHTREAIW